MLCAHPIDLDTISPDDAFAAHSSRRRFARRALRSFLGTLAPSVLLPAGLLAVGCCALLTLTGVGPRSWEARLCADGGLDLRSCRVATPVAPPAGAVVGPVW